MGQQDKKEEGKKQKKKRRETRQKNERGDSKVESNGSPDIQDRGETDRNPRPFFGVKRNVLRDKF